MNFDFDIDWDQFNYGKPESGLDCWACDSDERSFEEMTMDFINADETD